MNENFSSLIESFNLIAENISNNQTNRRSIADITNNYESVNELYSQAAENNDIEKA